METLREARCIGSVRLALRPLRAADFEMWATPFAASNRASLAPCLAPSKCLYVYTLSVNIEKLFVMMSISINAVSSGSNGSLSQPKTTARRSLLYSPDTWECVHRFAKAANLLDA